MGFWSNLFSGKKEVTKKEPRPDISIRKDRLRIWSMKFYGPCSMSSDKSWIIGWSDSDPDGTRGGHRHKGEGTFVLLHDDNLVYTGRMQRPNNGKVATNGTHILNDLRFGSRLDGIFCAFDCDGNEIISSKFRANLLSNGLSINGKFAACNTANSESEDGNIVAFFNLEEKKLLWKKSPAFGWPDAFEFDEEAGILHQIYKAGAYRYNTEGVFLDAKKWEEVWLQQSDATFIICDCHHRLQELKSRYDIQAADTILMYLDVALKKGFGNQHHEEAKAYRYRGEVYELMGDLRSATEAYEKAISKNSRVGVKKRLEKIYKKLSDDKV